MGNQGDIRGHQALKASIIGRMDGDQWSLIARYVAGEVLAIFAALELVIGPVRSLTDDTELAGLQVADLSDLLQQCLRR